MSALAELKPRMLGPPKRTLAVAESVTCGGIQQRIGRISGASTFFLGGMTVYALDEKVRHLGVDRAAAAAVNSVSAEVAAQMARGICAAFGADVGVATTGYAEPNEEWNVAEPFAFWAVALRMGEGHVVETGRVEAAGRKRAEAQDLFADWAVAALVRRL